MNRIVLLTGDGKGKTSSALGMALRAAGHGMRVCLIQFIKDAARETGEAKALKRLPEIEVHICGRGFVFSENVPDFPLHKEAAQAGLRLAAEKLALPEYGLVILDEICGAVSLGLVAEQEVCETIRHAAPGVAIVLTGRGAPQSFIDLADTVSSVTCVKHGLSQGISSQAGIEE